MDLQPPYYFNFRDYKAPMTIEGEVRWMAVYKKMAMAFAEAGYPNQTFDELDDCIGVIKFTDKIPPKEVIEKAGELCGVADLVALLYRDLWGETLTSGILP